MKYEPVPCPRCLALATGNKLRIEMVQPLPLGAMAPIGLDKQRCCQDCASADTLIKLGLFNLDAEGFYMARVAVGNERQEQYRLPGFPIGLVRTGLVRPSVKGDLEKHYAWLDACGWFGIEQENL